MKRTLALILTLGLMLGLFSFAQAEGPTIVVNIGSQPETLDPQMNSASDGSNYIKHLFEGLMRYEWDGSGIGLGVAESYEESEDGLVWIFKIRENATWSDGQDLTAEDFVYTMKRLVDPTTAAPYAGDMGKYLLNGLAIVNGEKEVDELGVKALDAKTLELTLEAPCGWFLEIMAFPTYYPVRKDIVEEHGDAWMTKPETLIGNGAFVLESWTMDEEIVMVPNEKFYGRDDVTVGKLVFKLITDPNAKLAAIRSGEIMYCDDYPAEEFEAVKAEGLYGTLPQLGTYYVNINNQKAPFDNVNVRKAFALAVDTTYIADTVMQGTFLKGSSFVGPGFLDRDGKEFFVEGAVIDRSDYEANKEAAKAALAEAGYPNGEGFPIVEYMTNVSGYHLPVAETLVAMWKDVLGVTVEIAQLEWNVFLDARRQGQHSLARDGWVADYGDPSNLLDLMTSYSGNNSTFYNNPEYDKMMQEVGTMPDPIARFELMRTAEKLAVGTDYACIPVAYYTTQFLKSPKLENVVMYPTGEKLFYTAKLVD